MPVSIAEFNAVCSQQGVEYRSPAMNRYTGASARHDPMWLAVQQVGRSLRKNPGEILADKIISCDLWTNDTAAQALQAMINGSIEPIESTDDIINFPCGPGKTTSLCGAAEGSFTNTVQYLSANSGQASAGKTYAPYGCEIYTNKNTPILLRKNNVPSALSLADIAINGIPYPRGSIFRIDTRPELESGQQYVSKNHLVIRDVSEIAKIAFGRLSIFAFRSGERYQYHGVYVFRKNYTADLWDWLNDTNIGEIRAGIAQTISLN